MTKKEFKALTGEDPEDMFGPDWENEIGELLKWERLSPAEQAKLREIDREIECLKQLRKQITG